MTPQKKAKELVKKYFDTCNYTIAGTATIFRSIAKQCALICVDEILKVASFYNDSQVELIYWQEVKQEIEKL